MGDVRLQIGGRLYDVACAEGDEHHLENLALIVNEKAQQAKLVVGDVNEIRQLLFAAIFMADELQNARSQGNGAEKAQSDTLALEINELADRIDRITRNLETSP